MFVIIVCFKLNNDDKEDILLKLRRNETIIQRNQYVSGNGSHKGSK